MIRVYFGFLLSDFYYKGMIRVYLGFLLSDSQYKGMIRVYLGFLLSDSQYKGMIRVYLGFLLSDFQYKGMIRWPSITCRTGMACPNLPHFFLRAADFPNTPLGQCLQSDHLCLGSQIIRSQQH